MPSPVKPTASNCYLCGQTISEKDLSRDHLPPKLFIPSEVRNVHNLNRLITLPAHKKCNASFSKDEEYFRLSVGTLGNENPIARANFRDARRGIRRPRGKGLLYKVLAEFSETTPKGLHLPGGKKLKTFETARIKRVIWKIIRGVYFHENNKALPPNCKLDLFLCHEAVINRPNVEELRKLTVGLPQKGAYPGLFAYRIGETVPPGMGLCGLLFWDSVFFIALFHLLDCPCGECPAKSYP